MLFGAPRQSQRGALVANAMFLLEVPMGEVLLDALRDHATTSLQLRLDGVVPFGQSFMALQSK